MNARIAIVTVFLACACIKAADAGMPAILPSGWTTETASNEVTGSSSLSSHAAGVRIQAFSFFVVVFLVSALLIKWINNFVRRDVAWLPVLSYGRSLGLLTLWGLAFVVVLTMISGARELMTPGAWKKQGWTYKLADSATATDSTSRTARQQGLEKLRTELWMYAALHDGRLPSADEESISANVWKLPGWPGLKFMSAKGQFFAEESGRLFVFEPDAAGDERLVLLTNGFIGTMSSEQITRGLVARTLDKQTPEGAVTNRDDSLNLVGEGQ